MADAAPYLRKSNGSTPPPSVSAEISQVFQNGHPYGDGYRGDCPLCPGLDTATAKPCSDGHWIGNCFRCKDSKGVTAFVRAELEPKPTRYLTKAKREQLGPEARETMHQVKRRKIADSKAKLAQFPRWRLVIGDGHPYLRAKGITAVGGVRFCDNEYDEHELMIPMHDADGKLRNLQRIIERPGGILSGNRRAPSKFEKRFLSGVHTPGLYLLIGTPTRRIHLVEGYADGASVHLATNEQVAVAFCDSNLPRVARILRYRGPYRVR